MKKKAFVCLVEVSPLKGCELDPTRHKGAIVRGYLTAESEEEAKRLMRESLQRDRFSIIKFEWCVPARETEWENSDDPDAERLITETEKKNGEVIYGRFDTWET